MFKYLLNRILRALLSVVLVIAVIMIMVYAFLDREAIFASDPNYPKMLLNKRPENLDNTDIIKNAPHIQA